GGGARHPARPTTAVNATRCNWLPAKAVGNSWPMMSSGAEQRSTTRTCGLARAGDLPRAYVELRRLSAASTSLELGRVALWTGHVDVARDCVAAMDADDARGARLAATIYAHAGRREEAEAALARAGNVVEARGRALAACARAQVALIYQEPE